MGPASLEDRLVQGEIEPSGALAGSGLERSSYDMIASRRGQVEDFGTCLAGGEAVFHVFEGPLPVDCGETAQMPPQRPPSQEAGPRHSGDGDRLGHAGIVGRPAYELMVCATSDVNGNARVLNPARRPSLRALRKD